MGYIGNTPADKYQTLQKQSFTTSATTSYTLSYSVTNPQDIALFINNVRQNPNSSYTVSGTTLTLSSATTGTDVMYAVFLGKSVGTIAPAVGSVTNDMLSGSIATSKLADGSNFGQTNSPYFSATTTAGQTISSDTMTLVSYPTENFDPDGVFTNTASNYKFTVPSGKAGTYSLTAKIWVSANGAAQLQNYFVEIRKNGTAVATTGHNFNSNDNYWALPEINTLQVLAVGDYIQVFAQVSDSSGSPTIGYAGNGTYAEFSGFKLI